MREGWTYKRFTEVCDVQYGYPFDSKCFTDDSNYMPLIRIRDVQRGYSDTFYTGEIPDGYTIQEGDYLVGMDGEFNIGIWGKRPGVLNQRVCKMTSSSEFLVNKYMFYFLKVCLKKIEDETPFVTVKHLSAKRINQIEIPLPSKSQQEAIVSELDEINSLFALKREQLQKYDKLAQSLFYEMFGDPVENEKGWEVNRFEELGTVITGSTPSMKDEDNYCSNDYCFIKPSDLLDNSIGFLSSSGSFMSEKGFQLSRKLPKGSVLVSCIGTIGKISILQIEATCNQQINAIIPNKNVDSIFLAYAIWGIKDVLLNVANAPVVPIINKSTFNKFVIPLPPLTLQQQFASRIEQIEEQKQQVQAAIEKLETLLASRMQYWFD